MGVTVSPDRTQDIRTQTVGALGVIDTYMKDAGLSRTRIVEAEIVVTTMTTSRRSTRLGRTGCRRATGRCGRLCGRSWPMAI